MTQHKRFQLRSSGAGLLLALGLLVVTASLAWAANVVTNGNFATDISGWSTTGTGSGITDFDGAVGGVAAGSLRGLVDAGRRREYQATSEQSVGQIQAGSTVTLSFYWYKAAVVSDAERADMDVILVQPDQGSVVLWSDTDVPLADSFLEGTVTNLDVSQHFDQTGTYTIQVYGRCRNGRDGTARSQWNFDDIVLDVTAGANNPPAIAAGATQVSVTPVNRAGAETTTISTTFTDSDQPGVGAFNVTFKLREPDNSTEVTLVNNQPNGSGGLTITDGGGGSYTASYTYDPAAGQALGFYDLYCEVTDGTDNAIDGYSSNTNELEIIQQTAPSVVAGATQVSVTPVNRAGAETTTISTTFTDSDQPGVGAFTVSFRIREPNNSTVLTLVDTQTNGNGGLTITDGGGGSYTASYTYDPSVGQTLGLYDLQFEVSDGIDNATDGYANNLDELEIIQQTAPSVVAGATQVSVSPVNRLGAGTTTISTVFTDVDQPGVGAFTVSFRIREPNNSTVLTLVDAQTNGNGGLTITDGGGGSYTASYTYDPAAGQALGLYDLQFEVSDGTDNATDGYTDNLDELEIIEQNAPTVVAGATQVSVSPVNRVGTETTTISTTFTDIDQPGVNAFTVSFRIREPNNSTVLTLVDAQTNGNGGLTITDGGGGSYTASYTYDPSVGQTLGLYDLQFEVSDGTDNATDGYAGNLDELEIIQQTAPSVVAGATQVSVSPVNRVGSATTTISTTFTDADQPGVGAFTVSFRIREPNNSTVLTLVDAQTNGNGGLTITDGGGGSYTASYTYDPTAGQTLGLYDLQFEVSDGAGNATDSYASNLDELEIIQQNAPTVVAGATQVSVSPVNRVGAETTTISTTFMDMDQPGVGAFNVTFKIREPNNATELTLVNNQPNGGGGLTITDGGGGSYTASYTYDPASGQTLGLYDLHFEVTDGVDTATDGYANNVDELDIYQQTAPTVTPGATAATISPVARSGAITTTLYADFTDADQPGIGAFTVTFTVRRPNNTTEDNLVTAASHGAPGVTIIDNGGGSYTAQYVWDPPSNQTLGFYDLSFQVSDGTDNATDGYANNLDELEVINNPVGNAPTVTAGATQVSVTPVNRFGTDTTVISTAFVDLDDPGVGAFNVTFKIREPDNSTEVVLVNNETNGNGGLVITSQGGGDYTASYTYDPPAGQAIGLHDLYFEVSDGTGNAIDGYADNLDELDIYEDAGNTAPTVAVGATQVNTSPVNRLGAATTTISTVFTDADQPAVGSFTVTLKIREPDNSTELILVNALTSGNGGLTVTSQGGGNYQASYTYNPDDAQTLGFYDLFFEVSDGTDNAIDGYANNLNELEINEVVANNPPVLVAGSTSPSVSPVNRVNLNTTTITADFNDADSPAVSVFQVTLSLRHPDNSTELVLVNDRFHGFGGLTITDNGGGSYTASYTYDPAAGQELGLYDLQCTVREGADSSTDTYANNLDELEIVEIFGNNPPVIAQGQPSVSISPVNRVGTATTVFAAGFSDADEPGIGAFTVTMKLREPDNSTEVVLVNGATHGTGGLTIIDNGGSYTARYTYDPAFDQALGTYDLYFEVTDGTDTAIDGYANNLDELEIVDIPVNNAPTVVAGATQVSPVTLDRFGAGTTEFSVDFADVDEPAVGTFSITFEARKPFNAGVITVADALSHGTGGMTVINNGGGSYTARIDWDPADNSLVGYYDLKAIINDGSASATDAFDDNPDELLITNGGENVAPIVAGDAVQASPAGIERIGANSTTLSALFTDGDQPGIGAFTVTFKIRHPDDSTETLLADNVGHGTGGVTISDGGGGLYTASISWDPPDAQTLGFYDLFFQVSDGSATRTDGYENNLDEMEVYDAVSNNGPTLVAGNTEVIPSSITRLGSEYTMIRSEFSDSDQPGIGAFTITIKVRDTSSTEYTLVNAATHGTQGLRVRHISGDLYEASMLWDPGVGQVTGTYDLSVSVDDNFSANVTDGYTNNADELTVTATAIPGDGFLLRRTNEAGSCGGPSNACHDMADHQSQDCLVCHTPHGSKNIFLVRETINTPNSGPKAVLFKTLGIGDPDNDPDPSAGDPNSGVMADDTDGVFTNICEVCHTTTGHHRNDGSHPPPAHNNANDCTGCHPHSDGFANTGGGESSGGQGCTCHNSIFNPMNTSTSSYHHMLDSLNPDYQISSKTCLMCHVDHDIFSPDLNTGIGARAKNLRRDITTSVVQGDANVLADFDYTSTGSGGICLSCHTSSQTKGYTQPDGTTQTPPISKTDFDAATTAHNYSVPSTFSSDGSTFNANCVKCHNDNRAKSYQSSTDKFGVHDSDYRRMLNPMNAASPSDPLEEVFCYNCHSTTSNPNAGSNLDYFSTKTMSAKALGIETTMGYTYAHPVETFSGRHKPIEGAADLADGATRHAECADCHGVHAVQQGTHDGSTNLISNALKGAWGVEPDIWPGDPGGQSLPSPSDNANAFVAPATYVKVEPAQKEYQICLKCHSNYTTLPGGARNLAEEINPNYPSSHGIVEAGDNPFCNTTTMNEPWASSKIAWCSDCHRSSNSADPGGPHGSNLEHLLVATVTSDETVGTPLCFVCHSEAVYWSTDAAASKYDKHPATQGSHKFPVGCFACHMWDYASTGGLGVQTTNDLAAGQIFVHGQNKVWNFLETDGTAGTGQPVENFINGYIANMDHTGQRCWAETCKNHSDKSW